MDLIHGQEPDPAQLLQKSCAQRQHPACQLWFHGCRMATTALAVPLCAHLAAFILVKVLPWGRAPCCLPAKHGSGQGDVSPQVLLCSPNR